MIKLLRDNILVEKIEDEFQTKAGILIHNPAPSRPRHGKVVAVGNGYTYPDGTQYTPQVKVGDIILYQPSKAEDVTIEDRDLTMFNEDCVLGIVNEK